MKPDSLSGMASGAKTVIGGVLAFYLGLILGTMLLMFHLGLGYPHWSFLLVGWAVCLFSLLGTFTGLLFLLLIGWTLVGLVWGEWNRFIGCILTAMLLITGMCVHTGLNPLDSATPILFFSATGTMSLVLLLAALQRLLLWHKHRKP